MDVRGLHGVTKELLIKPEPQEGTRSAKQLSALARKRADPLRDPAAALSEAIRAAREAAYVKVRRASDRHFRKLKKLGRLTELKFREGEATGGAGVFRHGARRCCRGARRGGSMRERVRYSAVGYSAVARRRRSA